MIFFYFKKLLYSGRQYSVCMCVNTEFSNKDKLCPSNTTLFSCLSFRSLNRNIKFMLFGHHEGFVKTIVLLFVSSKIGKSDKVKLKAATCTRTKSNRRIRPACFTMHFRNLLRKQWCIFCTFKLKIIFLTVVWERADKSYCEILVPSNHLRPKIISVVLLFVFIPLHLLLLI